MEEVNVGDLTDVKEQKTLIPPTKNVKVKIVKVDNKVNKDNTYRSLNLQLKISEGIGDDMKYKGKILFARVCYYADPNVYTKDFFGAKQHLIQLKYLASATGVNLSTVNNELILMLFWS